ncbi:MAG: response regulator, partial [Proteobacteria bacterium]|nr:response regulator [Pseudomonadota bacterium]
VEASVSLRRDAEGEPTGSRGIVRDVTEKQGLHAQLQQAQKMEAIATLAGGVAHEFNNALMGIMGNIELLKMDLPEDEGRDKYFDPMKSSGHRMSRLTDQLLAYAQGGKYQPKHLKLDDFMIQTLPILQHDLSPEVRVETHFPKDISYTKADYAQMQMVLSAILANSNEAIEEEGLIRITAGNIDLDEGFTKQHSGLKPGSYVCLTIEDDGKGMDEETRSGIFEPFFTTKFQGRGMGMAAVYGIIKNHDGWIYVGSELGKGTVVRIYLPAIEAKEEVKEDVVLSPTVELATGEGTILVIEDEEPLVEIFSQILERLGYRVLQARTGKEAVEFAKTFDGQIDLALLDIKLPDMEGGRVYPLIMKARPDLKVIVCSGYSIHGPAQAILDAGAEGFIQKPFSIAPFAEKLKEVLEGN